MQAPKRKRPPRIPLSPEQVAEIVWRKQEKENRQQALFKASQIYKICNIFNIAAVFVYFELLLSYFFVTNNSSFVVNQCTVHYGDTYQNGIRQISSLALNNTYDIRIYDYIKAPEVNSMFEIGKDFILQRDLVCRLPGSDHRYSVINSEPVLFLSFFVLVLVFILTCYNQNQKSYPLKVMTLINILSLAAFILL